MTTKSIERLAKLRGITTGQLIERAGISRVTWWRWINGRSMPNMRTVEKIINAASK